MLKVFFIYKQIVFIYRVQEVL